MMMTMCTTSLVHVYNYTQMTSAGMMTNCVYTQNGMYR